MRTLRFIISGQNIEKDPSCDFSGLVPGTKGYLRAVFTFDEEWRGCAKIAEFRNYLSSRPESEILEGDDCMIPEEVLTGDRFHVSVIGIKPGYRINTGNVEVKQNG